ncbi:30S ribosomal protein S4 [Candidatus Gottesmanbacteria bacterium]|nr:30S ribosomal protein S4 [Candidatus Gottesmanbacteria bacterium]
MARYRGPQNRLARREGTDLGLQTIGTSAHSELLKRLKISPGQHGHKGGRRKSSDYALQLREKQKVKRIYGLLEKQFARYFNKATRNVGNTGEELLRILETRLDNVIYKLNFAPTRAFARQIVTHGHVIVDGKKVNIPSFSVKPGQVITIKPKILETPILKKLMEAKDVIIPSWLEKKGPAGKVVRLPEKNDIKENISVQLIIEFYSR